MGYIIKKRSTDEYFSKDSGWVSDKQLAKKFPSVAKATAYSYYSEPLRNIKIDVIKEAKESKFDQYLVDSAYTK